MIKLYAIALSFCLFAVTEKAQADAVCDSLERLIKAADNDFKEYKGPIVPWRSFITDTQRYSVQKTPFPGNERQIFNQSECIIYKQESSQKLTCERSHGDHSSGDRAMTRLRQKFEACLGRSFKVFSDRDGLFSYLSLPGNRYDRIRVSFDLFFDEPGELGMTIKAD